MRALILALLLICPPLAAAEGLSDFAWMKGCWRAEQGADIVTEVWSAPAMPAMLGYAYTTRNGELRSWEQTRIEMIGGVPTFIAMPGGAAPTPFPLENVAPGFLAQFANPDHDFPKHVEYRRDGAMMVARVHNGDGDGGQVFAYRRIRCTGEMRP